MNLRGRLALAILVIAVPIVTAIVLGAFSLRRAALVEATYDETLERMEAGARERCELGADRIARRRGRRGRNRRGRGPLRARRHYDHSFAPGRPGFGPLEPALREPLEAGETTAAIFEGRRATVAMRMPWDGPCAVLVVDRFAGAAFGGAHLRWAILIGLGLVLLVVAVVYLALGPAVRRIRRLEASVREQAAGGYEKDVTVEGSDEVADLAVAFNEASAQIRERMEELTERDRSLTEFLASTTHDVMVPLTVLLGHLSDLRESASENRPPDGVKVRGAVEEAHYIGSLLRNLSAAARLDRGEPMLTRHDFDLRALVERVVSRHRPIAEDEEVAVDFAVPDDEVIVHADSTLAEQAVNNLVHNAIRYNRAGGHVAVTLERRGDCFELCVLDDGPGIPDEELERVHERRFRGGAARSRRPTGLGLGLHIVRDVAEKHRWQLRFESPEEGGLRVRIRGQPAR